MRLLKVLAELCEQVILEYRFAVLELELDPLKEFDLVLD